MSLTNGFGHLLNSNWDSDLNDEECSGDCILDNIRNFKKNQNQKRKVCFIIQDENSKTIISKLFWQHCAEGNTKGVHILIIYPLFDNPLTWTRN